jgi:TonB-linked SusC/RagA family outer membrane protein
MRKFLVALIILLLCGTSIYAQRSVTGRVLDSKTGTPIQSATVTVKGSNVSTQTGADGSFTISVAQGARLVFSSVGFTPTELVVGTQSSVDVTLEQRSNELTEVVVTALGVSREKRTLGYATTTIKTDEINRVSPVSMFDGLQGKVAGVDISNVSGNPGGSSKVILRGYSSLAGNNQPLYIVDGVPISDVRPGSEGLISPDALTNKGFQSPGYDFGNTANDINPGDIETLTVLKGAGATSIYGSRGANGVIIITTRKGRSGKIKVDVNMSAIYSQPGILPRTQTKFGQGWDAQDWLSENGSWGPRLDGQQRVWGALVDNSQLLKPYRAVEDNVRDLYETGSEYNNSVSVSGGNDNSTFMLSYGNIYSDGIIPSDNDAYRRNSLSLRGTTRYKGFTAEASLNYVNRAQRFVETGQSASGIGSSFFEQVLQIPVDIPIADLRDYKNKYFNVDNYFTPFAENPYYTLMENGSRARNDRFYGSVNLNYKATDWMTFQVQQGIDITNGTSQQWRNKNAPTPGSWNAGSNPESASRSADIGSVQEGAQKYYEYDTKVNALFNHEFDKDFTLDGLVGVNYNERGSDILYAYIEDLALPGFFDITNGINPPQATHYRSKQAIFGTYASATLGYKDYLYLTVTGRNDWSSTLPKSNNAYFYPSANLSFLLTNLLDIDRQKISYAKLRASYGKTGKDAQIYSVYDGITSQIVLLPFGQISFPFNSVPGYTLQNTLGNSSLQPEISTESEIGAEFRILNDRVGFDIAYYTKLSKGQIINVPITPSTGYSSVTLNFGEIRNRGVELAVNVTPIRSKDFTWDISYNYTRNRNTVLQLPTGLDKVTLNQGAYDAKLEARLNQPLGVIYAPTYRKSPDGKTIVDPNTGFPIGESEDAYYGASQRDYTMGLVNSFSYKNFRLGFSFDYRKGGVFYSSTSELLMFTGNHYLTTYNDRNPFIIPNSVNEVIDQDGKASYVENMTVLDEAHQDDYWYANSNRAAIYQYRILDKTFLKLRDVTLSYTFPDAFAKRISASKIIFSVIGRNLWTRLPSSNQIIDPETSNFGRDITSELGEFRVGPMPRSLGASLKVSF